MQSSCSSWDGYSSQQPSDSLEYAGFWVRLAAYLIDSVVVLAGLLIVRLVFQGISLAGGDWITGTDILFHYSLQDIILYVLKVLYFIAFTYLTGTTLGKRAMNLCVMSENPKEKLTLINVIYRETVGRFLCSLPLNIGYFIVGLDSKKRGFHDMLCDTRVVYLKKVKVRTKQQMTPEMDEHTEIQENIVEKRKEQEYNMYHLVKDQPEKETESTFVTKENVLMKDTEG